MLLTKCESGEGQKRLSGSSLSTIFSNCWRRCVGGRDANSWRMRERDIEKGGKKKGKNIQNDRDTCIVEMRVLLRTSSERGKKGSYRKHTNFQDA